MLIFSRKRLETIKIGNATITVLSQGRAKIGVEAPREVKVLRGELKTKEGENDA